MKRVVGILITIFVVSISGTYLFLTYFGGEQGITGGMPQLHDWLNGKSLTYDLQTARPPEEVSMLKTSS
ncbi:MAG: hypothetical protein ACE5EN_06060 [Nitrospinota bacterium]